MKNSGRRENLGARFAFFLTMRFKKTENSTTDVVDSLKAHIAMCALSDRVKNVGRDEGV